MKQSSDPVFPILKPDLQVSFCHRLEEIKRRYLYESVRKALMDLDIQQVDDELAQFVAKEHLSKVAGFGLRGETVFAVPVILGRNPFTLGYYRLLLGFSQKEFYNKGPFGALKALEDSGELPERTQCLIAPLCRSLVASAQMLIDGIDILSIDVIRDLQLLTVGPQLRGGENARLGQLASKEVYSLLRGFMAKYLKAETIRTLIIQNEAGRLVEVVFSNDPDVRIVERLQSRVRPLVSIEIKGGADASNIHNRLGEAEKSHQKARRDGFFEFWTIARVEVEESVAHSESPTTSHFFHLDLIQNPATEQHRRFRELVCSILGIRS